MTNDEKPDGWVAWSAEGGKVLCTFTEHESESVLLLADTYDYPITGEDKHDASSFLSSEDGNKYCIRPVKLVFTDEPHSRDGGSTPPPATPITADELIEVAENWSRRVGKDGTTRFYVDDMISASDLVAKMKQWVAAKKEETKE